MARRPLERERVYLDGGRRTTQLMRDSLGGAKELMPGIRIRDLREGGFLAFDLTDLLNVLGPRALTSTWKCSVEECISIEHARRDLEHAYSASSSITGKELVALAAETRQIIDGVFEGYGSGENTPWIKLEAIDSTYWEVTAPSAIDLAPFRARFSRIEDIENGAA